MNVRVGSLLVRASRANFREGALNVDVRTALFTAAVNEAVSKGVHVLVLPAGFFRVASSTDATALAKELCSLIAERRVAVGFGIDVGDAEKHGDKRDEKTNGLYPFFGFIIECGRLLFSPVQQTGVSTDEVDDATAESRADERIGDSTIVAGASIALLMCGEVQSPSWRAALQRRSPSVILHPSHASVQLDGYAKESWRLKIADLLEGLPESAVWAFSDHVAGEQHLDSRRDFVPLVRQGGNTPANCVSWTPLSIEGEHGWLYLYDAEVAPSAR